MPENFTLILRFGLAAFNGLLFSVGLFIVLEILLFRPKRWKTRQLWLLRQLNEGDQSLPENKIREYEKELSFLRQLLKTWKQDPKIMLQVAFGCIMVCVAFFSLLSLLVPSANPFI